MDDLPPALTLHHDHADTVVDKQLLAAGLAALSQRQREVLALRYFEDLSVADTAAIMGTSEGTVKSYTSRALQQLRQFLGGRATDENTEASHVN
jgi:RNA polymerase sigma factor (sigma-70 family)